MLTTGEAITRALTHYVNPGSASVENDTALRARSLFFLDQVAKEAWLKAPWWWRHGNGTVSGVTTSGTMPSDFGHLGKDGQVYVSGQRYPMTFVEPGEFNFLRINDTATVSAPTHYTLSGKTALGLSQIQVWPTAATAVTLEVKQYVKKLPSLVDRPGRVTTAEGSAGNPNGAYTYKVTFVTADGETELGPASTSRTVSSKRINLSAIPVSSSRAVTSRKVYRTAASGTTYKLVTTLSDNTTTTYEDNTADGSLGADAPAITAAVSGLEVFPDDMIEPLLIEWLIAKHKESQGDLRAEKALSKCEQNVTLFWAEYRQGQNQPQTFPPFGAGSYTGLARSWRDRLGN